MEGAELPGRGEGSKARAHLRGLPLSAAGELQLEVVPRHRPAVQGEGTVTRRRIPCLPAPRVALHQRQSSLARARTRPDHHGHLVRACPLQPLQTLQRVLAVCLVGLPRFAPVAVSRHCQKSAPSRMARTHALFGREAAGSRGQVAGLPGHARHAGGGGARQGEARRSPEGDVPATATAALGATPPTCPC